MLKKYRKFVLKKMAGERTAFCTLPLLYIISIAVLYQLIQPFHLTPAAIERYLSKPK